MAIAINYGTVATFKEVAGNNGAIATSITITLTGDTFKGNNGDALGTVTGTPTGLTAVLVKTSATTAKLSFTGNATDHADTDGIADLAVEFTAADFTSGSVVGATGLTKTDFAVDFVDPFAVGTLAITAPTTTVGKLLPTTLTGSATTTTSKVYVFNGTKLLGEATVNGTTGLWSYTVPAATKDGVFNFVAREGFTEGTKTVYGPATPVVSYTVDSKAPAAPTVNPIKLATADTTPTITGKAEKGATVEVFAGTSSLGKVVADAKTGAWALTVGEDAAATLKELVGGATSTDYVITAKAKDAASNESAATTKTVTLTVDTDVDAPVVTLGLKYTNETAKLTTKTYATQKLEGTAEKNSTIQFYGGEDGTVALGKAIKVSKDGAWKTSLKLDDGKHIVSAVVTDVAGNISAATSLGEVTVDTFAPVTPTLTAPTTLTGTALPTTLSGTAEKGSVVSIWNGTTKLYEFTEDDAAKDTNTADGAWTVNTSGFTGVPTTGAVKFTVKATDAAGNVSKASTAVTYTLKTGTASTFTVTESTGVLTFGGTATGDITVTNNGGTLTFTRGSVEATTKPLITALTADTGIPALTGTDKLVMSDAVFTAIAAKLAPAAAVKLSDTTLALASLKTIEAGQTGLVDATAVTATTGTVADAKLLLVTNEGTTGDKIDMAAAVAVTLTDAGSTADTGAILSATTGVVTTYLLDAGTYANFASGDKIDTGLTFATHTSATLAGDSSLEWNFNAGTLTLETADTGTATTVALVLTGVTAVAEVDGVFTLTV